MKNRQFLSWTLLALFLGGCVAPPPNFSPGMPTKRECPEASVVDFPFDPDREIEEVVLRAGDQLKIQVLAGGQTLVADCSRTVTLPSRGLVTYPYLGGIQLRGKTLGALRNLLVKRLKGRVVKDPVVKVEIIDFAPRVVTLEGMFVSPGQYNLDPLKKRSLTLEVLEHGRGLKFNADRHQILLRRRSKYRLTQQTIDWCELVKPSAKRIVLQAGDHIHVKAVKPLRIMGAVVKPIFEMAFPAKPIRVYELVQLAGGLTRFAEDEIEIRRQKKDGSWGSIKVDFDDILNNPLSEHNIELLPGDRVQVNQSPY